jgi:hypothetical protein
MYEPCTIEFYPHVVATDYATDEDYLEALFARVRLLRASGVDTPSGLGDFYECDMADAETLLAFLCSHPCVKIAFRAFLHPRPQWSVREGIWVHVQGIETFRQVFGYKKGR